MTDPNDPPPTSPQPTTHRGPEIPGLELIREIGSGGHSTVYLARQVDHDRQVAAKILDAALDDGPGGGNGGGPGGRNGGGPGGAR